jgi:hypothetical protein
LDGAGDRDKTVSCSRLVSKRKNFVSRGADHAAHVRNAIARFKQVQGVTDAERDAAWKRIKSAAKKHKVDLNEQDWRELT